MLNKDDKIKMRKTTVDGQEVFEVIFNGVISYYKTFEELPEEVKEGMRITARNRLIEKKLVVEVLYKNKNSITINEYGEKQKFKNIDHVPEFYKKLIYDTFEKKKAMENKRSGLEKCNNLMKINNETDVVNEYVFDDKIVGVVLDLNPIWKSYLAVGIALFVLILYILFISIDLKII